MAEKDQSSSSGSTHRGGSGNFAEDRERALEARRKGGEVSGGNFANDRKRAAEARPQGRRDERRQLCQQP
jgi:general stress protein YciG